MICEKMRDARGTGVAGGIALLLVSAAAFSTAGLFTRMVPVSLTAMVFWRNGFGCVGLALLMAIRAKEGAAGWHRLGPRGWMAVACSAFATVCYLAAFAHTSVADIAIIYATAPIVTAALAWLALGERPTRRTLLAAGAALVGVAVTVIGPASDGTMLGDGLALAMTLALSAVAVLARGAALPALATSLAAALLAAVAMLPAAYLKIAGLGIGLRDACWLAVFGLVTMTIALPAYLAGAARVPAERTMLISAVELPLAPLWVWLVLGEVPRPATMLGGAIVLAAVVSEVGRTVQT